jgi:hypothetical protein
VFDQGAGIPYTLPANALYESIRVAVAKYTSDLIPSDALMLKAAMETGRTRTQEAHRGLGLQKMRDVVTGIQDGYLRIISGNGEIMCRSDGSTETTDHKTGIGGTLIEWCLPATALEEEPETTNDDD